MPLQVDSIDLLEVAGLRAVSDGLEEGTNAEIAHAPEHSVGRAHDERERVRSERW